MDIQFVEEFGWAVWFTAQPEPDHGPFDTRAQAEAAARAETQGDLDVLTHQMSEFCG